ncbi:polyprenol phosphomannose-dependent alpha 1,6 mannosyltransferase MptB [Rhizomonospora bruguierae]|uniref:polyprenol phosphomannose-dependent alpha 1,6 mannosyltransferase MptB n=1 Tax=Rhizomonospora bruguierae TaxID=1581705 RepID=UPI001BCD2561|nr:polyprenol phosphomannose-dependent alpha 1,6 mannosyltransferase MptB [Micromonospora sp. NBRC 107566]
MRGPERLRYAGLGATVLLAAGAYGAGALPGGDPAPRFVPAWLAGTSTAYRLGLVAWAAGLALLGVAWWRLGGRLGWAGARWLLATAALWALPLLLAPPLASRDVYAYACQGALWADGRDPYTTGVAAGCPWLEAVPPLWQTTPTPYGPLAVALSGGAAAIARALPLGTAGQLLAAVTVLRLLALAGVALAAGSALRLARCVPPERTPGEHGPGEHAPKESGPDGSAPNKHAPGERAPNKHAPGEHAPSGSAPSGTAWAVWLAALAPLVLVHAVSGAHNDALLAGLVAASLAVAARPSPAHAAAPAGRSWRGALAVGALLGLAAAVKVTAIVAVPFAVLLVARRARVAAVARSGAIALAGLVGAFAAGTGAAGLGLGWVGALRDTGTLVQWTSVPTAVGMAAGYPLRALGWAGGYATAVAVARVAGLLAMVLVYAALLRWCWRRLEIGRILLACGAAFTAVLLLSPVFYPWYALTPLAVLAAVPLGTTGRRWLAGGVIALSALILPQGLGVAVLTKLPGAYLVTAALAVLAWRWRRRGARGAR